MSMAGEAADAAAEKTHGGNAQEPRAARPEPAPHSDAADLLVLRVEFESALRSLVLSPPYGSAGSAERKRYGAAVARTVTLARKLDEAEDAAAYREAFALVVMLGRKEPDLDAAQTILADLEYRCAKNWHIAAIVGGIRNFLLALTVPLTALLWFGATYHHLSGGKAITLAIAEVLHGRANLLLCTGFGIFGAIVSMLARMQEFAAEHRKSRDALHAMGLCLPVVGGAFGFVTYALFASGLIGFPVGDGGGPTTPDGWQFYVVVGFLSGFSERFTRGLLDGTASVLGKGAVKAERKEPEKAGRGRARPAAEGAAAD